MLAQGWDRIFWPPVNPRPCLGAYRCWSRSVVYCRSPRCSIYVWKHTAYPTGLQCSGLDYILASLGCCREHKQENKTVQWLKVQSAVEYLYMQYVSIHLDAICPQWREYEHCVIPTNPRWFNWYGTDTYLVFLKCILPLYFQMYLGTAVETVFQGAHGVLATIRVLALGEGTGSINIRSQYLHTLTAHRQHGCHHQYSISTSTSISILRNNYTYRSLSFIEICSDWCYQCFV